MKKNNTTIDQLFVWRGQNIYKPQKYKTNIYKVMEKNRLKIKHV